VRLIQITRRALLPLTFLGSLAACRGPAPSEAPQGEALRAIEEAMARAENGEVLEGANGDAVWTEADYAKALEEAYLSGGEDGAADGGDEADPDAVPDSEADQDPLPEIDLDDLLLGASAQDASGPALSPYEEFGERIVWYRDSGLIMKPFTFPLGSGVRVRALIETHSGLTIHGAPVDDTNMPEGDQPPGSVVLHVLQGQGAETFTPPRTPGVSKPTLVPLSDWLVVTAAPAEMRQVQRFVRVFVSNARQIQVEAKIVELTTTKTSDYGIRPVDGVTPIFGLPNAGSLVHSVDFSFGNTVDVGEAIFGVSAVFDGVQFNALLEMISTDESASIISQPKVAVREGARAELVEVQQEPVMKLNAINADGQFTWTITFREVGVQLYVVPRIIGSNTLILDVDTEVSQITGTAATFIVTDPNGSTSTVGIPEVARRRATTTVRLDAGQGLVIGGLISERTLQREKKVPLLGDLPLLGGIFRSRYQVQERTDVLFFIYPRILQGIDLNSDF
jgi:type II secretory pathway component GspD/PulD (secretin)